MAEDKAQQPKDRNLKSAFAGFERPTSNYFKMPTSWTDITAQISNLAELKVVEYILRHTWGYQEYGVKKLITIDEFVHGRRRRDGSRLDNGTGLSERGVRYGLDNAVKDGLIEEETDDSDRGRIKKYYCLKMREGLGSEEDVQDLHPEVQSLHPHLQGLPPRGAKSTPRSEKDTLERNLKNSIYREGSQSTENVDNFNSSSQTEANSVSTFRPVPPGIRQEGNGTFTPVGKVVAQKNFRRPRQEYDEDRQVILRYVEDFAREFNDRASLKTSTTRAYNLFRQAQISRDDFIARLYEAEALTKERTAAIRSTSQDSNQAFPVKNKMPYFFAILADVLQLREEKSGSAGRRSGPSPP